jgi:hypothetical protein
LLPVQLAGRPEMTKVLFWYIPWHCSAPRRPRTLVTVLAPAMGIDQFRRNHFDGEVDDGSLDRMTEAHRHDAAARAARC